MSVRALGVRALLIFAYFASSPVAQATPLFHYDLGAGQARFSNASQYYSLSGREPQNGTAFHHALYYDLIQRVSFVRLFFGFNHRYFFTTAHQRSQGTMTLHPSLRLSIWLFYFTGGYSPWVWQRDAVDWGIQGFSRNDNSRAYFAEAGVEIPVVPIVSILGSIGAQRIVTGGVASPNPVYEATVGFRFYFGPQAKKGRAGYGSFPGWRYPFGVERR